MTTVIQKRRAKRKTVLTVSSAEQPQGVERRPDGSYVVRVRGKAPMHAGTLDQALAFAAASGHA